MKKSVSILPLLLSFLSFAFILAGAFSIFVTQAPLNNSQDVREQAAVDKGKVLASLTAANQLKSNEAGNVNFQVNTQGVQIEHLQFTFDVASDAQNISFTPTATSSTGLKLTQNDSATLNGGKRMTLKFDLENTNQPFSSTQPVTIGSFKLDKPMSQPIRFTFDKANSTAIVNASTPSVDELRTIADATFDVDPNTIVDDLSFVPAQMSFRFYDAATPSVEIPANQLVIGHAYKFDARYQVQNLYKNAALNNRTYNVTLAADGLNKAIRNGNPYSNLTANQDGFSDSFTGLDFTPAKSAYEFTFSVVGMLNGTQPSEVTTSNNTWKFTGSAQASSSSVTVRSCNQTCTSNSQCANNYRCYNGACRLTTNPTSPTCAVATTSVVNTVSTSSTKGQKGEEKPLPSSTPVTPTPLASFSPRPVSSPAEYLPPAGRNTETPVNSVTAFFNALSERGLTPARLAISAGIAFLALALIALLLGRGRRSMPPKVMTSTPVESTSKKYEDELRSKIEALRNQPQIMPAAQVAPSVMRPTVQAPQAPAAPMQPSSPNNSSSMMERLKSRGVMDRFPNPTQPQS